MHAHSIVGHLALAVLLTACGPDGSNAATDTNTATSLTTTAAASNANVAQSAAASKLSTVPAGLYQLDKGHGYINLSYSHLGFSNPTIGFRDFSVRLNLDPENISNSTLAVDIDINSIDSRVAKFDEHLVGDKMFDTANYPNAAFVSTNVDVLAADKLAVTGDLTIKDVSKSVTLDTTINKASNHPMGKKPTIGVSANVRINRSDWGLGYATPHVGNEVDISIEVELPQAQSTAQ